MSSRVTTIMNGVPVDIMMMSKRPWLDEEDLRSFVKSKTKKQKFSLEPARAYEFMGADPKDKKKKTRLKLETRLKLHPRAFKKIRHDGANRSKMYIDHTLAVRLVTHHCPDGLEQLLQSLYKKFENDVVLCADVFQLPRTSVGLDSLSPLEHEMLSPLGHEMLCPNGSPAATPSDTLVEQETDRPFSVCENDDAGPLSSDEAAALLQ